MAEQIKGFKHLRPGAEVAIATQQPFTTQHAYRITTIDEVDMLAGTITVHGSGRTFRFDGSCLYGSYVPGEPTARLVAPVTDEVRRAIWRAESRERLETLLHNWRTVDDQTIERVMAALDSRPQSD